jgi:transcriptional regulator with XRE-family HTH domain
MTQGALARALGTSSGVVNRWVKGVQRPSLPFALALEQLLEIPASEWAAKRAA